MGLLSTWKNEEVNFKFYLINLDLHSHVTSSCHVGRHRIRPQAASEGVGEEK
jgi:hypothetical protein